ncbi:AAA family ATPase [Oscillatoria sp. FACHB-1407]|uniref:ParA family protein n=1 Tax=Oscillatoria sp. FACHB-1407 TaxID=2692847 RepID=UPI001681ECCA|nr:AAA family ATPase [Oscillatoria sp. FACHB-1407]MBD2462186.1 AAA family ATPase [Oscillatoria sp. FACHB-1407]
MPLTTLQTALQSLPEGAQEPIVTSQFAGHFLEALGFASNECCPGYNTKDRGIADYALRKNLENDIFINTKTNPYVMVELKGRQINLSPNSSAYRDTYKQIEGYLLSENTKSSQWGLITNSIYVQLFRKHGRVIYPATTCLKLNLDNVDEIANFLRDKIHHPPRALTVAVYNNKGGVGKTTTVVNLAATLTLKGKRVLIVDFDPNQQDLTNSLGIPLSDCNFYEILNNKKSDIRTAIKPFSIRVNGRNSNTEIKFDVIPADRKLAYEIAEIELRRMFKFQRLSQVLKPLKSHYDYILIDSPPNWRIFSQSAVYASDVVLIPTKHNNIYSIENAVGVIKQFIPEIQEVRDDGGPIALPIFFNGEKTTETSLTFVQKEINRIVETAKEDGFDLSPYFLPTSFPQERSKIFELPGFAHIANAAFARIPAVYRNKTIYEYYVNLAKEYFLQ